MHLPIHTHFESSINRIKNYSIKNFLLTLLDILESRIKNSISIVVNTRRKLTDYFLTLTSVNVYLDNKSLVLKRYSIHLHTHTHVHIHQQTFWKKKKKSICNPAQSFSILL